MWPIPVDSCGWTEGIPELRSNYVCVREVETSDAPALFELLTDPAVGEHMAPPPPTARAFAGFIAWAHERRRHGESVCFGIVPAGLHAAVGIIQVRAQEPSFFTAEWGFALGQPFWGTGVFVEAASLVARFAFGTMHVNRLEARAVVHNGRGNGALKKLGARPEGTLKHGFRRGDRFDPQFLWSLAADDFRQPLLVPERFAPDATSAAVQHAIDIVRGLIVQNRRVQLLDEPPLYPFFVSREKCE